MDVNKIKEGFKINWMTMGDAETGEVLWKSKGDEKFTESDIEIEARIPAKILQCESVSREVNFSSCESMKKLRVE